MFAMDKTAISILSSFASSTTNKGDIAKTCGFRINGNKNSSSSNHFSRFSTQHNGVTPHLRDAVPRLPPMPRPAVSVFDETPGTDAPYRATASLIQRRARDGRPIEALALFCDVVSSGLLEPEDFPVATVLHCFASVRAVRSGRELHGFMMRRTGRIAPTCYSQSSLVNFYAKCGSLLHARRVFDEMTERDIVAWTVMLKAYADGEGYQREMMHLFLQMLDGGTAPNCHTLSVLLDNTTLELGEQLHAYITKLSFDSDAFVGSSLVDVYARSGKLGLAQLVFDRIALKDAVCYNCLISGYGRTGIIEGLLSVYLEMCLQEVVPNESTFVGLLGGCANSGLVGLSKQFHAQAIARGFISDEMIQGSVIDMYAKCGDIKAGRAAFDTSDAKQNVAIWNSIICGYGKHGHTIEALRIFDLMESAFVRPDHITFICLLSACSHSGLVEEGWRLFCLMQEGYGIPAREEHYSCMVDLFGRAGMVRQAYELISRSACMFGPTIWGALLSACRVHGNAYIGEIAARNLFELEPKCSGSYVALANIYATGGQWEQANSIRELMEDQGIQKDTGYSWIEMGGIVHKFRAGGGNGDPDCMEEVFSMCRKFNYCACDIFYPQIQ